MMRYFSLILLITILAACVSPPPPTIADSFRGLWKMHIFEYKDSTGQWQEYFWNKGGTGYVLYDGLGHMAIHVTPQDYERSTVSLDKGLDSLNMVELKAATALFSSNYVYMANCQIKEAEEIIEHERLSHTFPDEWHQLVQRRYAFRGDTLTLSPVEGKFERRLTLVKQP